ncbi:MAG: SlyX family protein [PVC group bacterium]|nr:SlyX family protein [PVC group bacterium]
MEKRIIELEKKLSFQDHEIEKLNEVITEHQKRIDELEKMVVQLKAHQQSGSLVKDVENEEPPPHY